MKQNDNEGIMITATIRVKLLWTSVPSSSATQRIYLLTEFEIPLPKHRYINMWFQGHESTLTTLNI